MFRKRTIYIILLIIFTLILCAEAALCIFLPNRFGRMDRTNGFAAADMSGKQIPEGFGRENIPEDMQRSQGGRGNRSNQTQEDSADADNESMSMPEMPTGMEMPADISAMERPSGDSFGILYTLKNLWMVIIPVCVLADAFCIFMLIRISRREQKKTSAETEEPAPKIKKEEKKDLHKKKKRSRIISLVIVVVFVAVIAILPTMLGKETDMSSAEVKEEIISATAEKGSITTTLLSGGVLTDDTALTVSIPATVELGEYAVENGDIVKEGDLIAAVEKSSVMIAVAEMQDAIDALDKRLEESADDTVSTTVTMPSNGRVKKIYAAENDDVADVMYEHGALMLISLDGMMAVDIESESLSIGDHVTVVLSDGSEETGRIAKITENSATVTLSDETAVFGEAADVLDENGKQLGSGELYISSELKITGYAGTVSKIYAEENEELSAGKKLLTTEEDNYTANYSALYQERTELEERLAKLLTIYRDGGIYAEYSGEITGIADEEAEEETEGSVEETVSAEPMSGMSIMQPRLASAEAEEKNTEKEDVMGSDENQNTDPSGQERRQGIYPAKISKISYNSIDVLIAPEAVTVSDPSKCSFDEALLTVQSKLDPVEKTLVYAYANGEKQQKTLSDLQANDLLLCEYDENGILLSIIYQHVEQQPNQQQQKPSGGMMTNMGGNSTGGAEEQPVEKEYELTETAVCEIIPDELMTVSISVDELDILSLSLGQNAVIIPDSMTGQTFEGEIIEIDRTGTNEGGNTKYAVTLKIARTEAMLSGMNASVRIDLRQHTGILAVPVEALYEVGTKTILYTGYDEREDTLIDPIEITTGYSDGDLVEITSGLAEGEQFCYRYADTIVYSFN